MSDYGFATYDEKTGKLAEKINSKYPIFGPEYRGIDAQYRTISIVETVQNSPDDAYVEMLGSWPNRNIEYWLDGTYVGYAHARRYKDTLITSFEHHLGYRPLCYFWVTGTVVQNCRCAMYQYLASGSGYGGSFNRNKTFTRTGKVGAAMNYMVQTDRPEGYIWQNQYVTIAASNSIYGYHSDTDIQIPNACMPAFSEPEYNASEVIDSNAGNNPYFVVVDDKEVKVYRRHWYSDHQCRVGTSSNGSPDIRQRTKCNMDYAGTNVDITVYLVPYSLEDLG